MSRKKKRRPGVARWEQRQRYLAAQAQRLLAEHLQSLYEGLITPAEAVQDFRRMSANYRRHANDVLRRGA